MHIVTDMMHCHDIINYHKPLHDRARETARGVCRRGRTEAAGGEAGGLCAYAHLASCRIGAKVMIGK